jgi:hypothetical protein
MTTKADPDIIKVFEMAGIKLSEATDRDWALADRLIQNHTRGHGVIDHRAAANQLRSMMK